MISSLPSFTVVVTSFSHLRSIPKLIYSREKYLYPTNAKRTQKGITAPIIVQNLPIVRVHPKRRIKITSRSYRVVLRRRHLDDSKTIVFWCRPSSANHECPTALLVEPATTPMPAREVFRVFVLILAASSAASILPPLRTSPLHTTCVLSATTGSSFLLLRKVCEGLPWRETTESYDSVRTEVGYRER